MIAITMRWALLMVVCLTDCKSVPPEVDELEYYATEEEVPESIKMMERFDKEGTPVTTWEEPTPTESYGSSANAVFERRKYEIRDCWENEIRYDNDLSGTMRIRWTIGKRGFVDSVESPDWNIASARVIQCIKGRIRSWVFDPPPGGSYTMGYDYTFKVYRR